VEKRPNGTTLGERKGAVKNRDWKLLEKALAVSGRPEEKGRTGPKGNGRRKGKRRRGCKVQGGTLRDVLPGGEGCQGHAKPRMEKKVRGVQGREFVDKSR